MRLGINGISLGPHTSSGIPRHILEVCKRLDQTQSDWTFFLYVQSAEGIEPFSERWTIREEPSALWRKLRPNVWLKWRCRRLLQNDNLDVFWSGTGLLPSVPNSLPCCLTVHDLNVKIVPKTMPTFTRLAFLLFFKSDLRRADTVLAISKGTAYRLEELYGVRAHGICTNGVSEIFRPSNLLQAQETAARYGLKGSFCLAVGTIEPRKNIMNLIKAFDKLDQKGSLANMKLAIVGELGWRSHQVEELIKKFEGRWLRRLGFVPDIDLAKLYSAAHLFIMPSLYEGFGIPIVEARACGARVAVTKIPELSEHCGDDAILIDGTNEWAIANAIEPALRLPKPSNTPNLTLPTWDAATSVTSAALEEAIKVRVKRDR